MAGSGIHDNNEQVAVRSLNRSDSSGSSSATHRPVDDQHQHYNMPPEYNVDPSMQPPQPPPGYPASEASVSQGPPYQHQTSHQIWYANPNAPPWQNAGAGAPPAAAYPPTHHQYGYEPNPQAAPSSSQQQEFQHQPHYQPQHYGSRPYNNAAPTRPPPGNFYAPQPQAAPHSPGPLFVPPMRAPAAQTVPMSPRHPYNPGMIRQDLGPPVPWTSDIFGFLQDCHGCFLTILAPCITFGQIAEIMDTGYNSCMTAGVIYAFAFLLGVPCLYSYTYRTKMRRHFNLRADPLDDLCLHFWCELCALSQEYRELAYRGIDPSLGYAMQQGVIAQAMDHPVSPAMGAPVAMNMMK